MKPRARRVTLAAAVLGGAVLAALVIGHWGTVCDHVEAWHFQVTRQTTTHEPDPDPAWVEVFKTLVEAGGNSLFTATLPQILANSSSTRVIVDPGWGWELETREIPWGKRDFAADAVLQAARETGIRILEQRFPRRAYVIIPDADARVRDQEGREQVLKALLDEIDSAK